MQPSQMSKPDLRLLPPIAPHLRESAVLKMLQEEGEAGVEVAPTWPPPGLKITRPAGFMGKISTGKGPGGRPVEWPPRDNPDQINDAPNQTTTYPSTFKFMETPNEDAPAKVVMSQPAFKISQPIKRCGDDKWPPRGSGEPMQEEVRQFMRPQKMNKDYGGFFAKNALPHNYAAYRPPPGTQHKAPEEGETAQVAEEVEEEEEEEEEEEDEEEYTEE